MWCCGRMEKIIWIDLMRRNIRVKEERNILNAVKTRKETKEGRKANLIGRFLRRNCLLKHCIEGEIAGRR